MQHCNLTSFVGIWLSGSVDISINKAFCFNCPNLFKQISEQMTFLEATIWLTVDPAKTRRSWTESEFHSNGRLKGYGRGRANVVTHDCCCGLAHNRVSRDSPKH